MGNCSELRMSAGRFFFKFCFNHIAMFSLENGLIPFIEKDTPFVIIFQSWNVQLTKIRGKVKSKKLQNALLLFDFAFKLPYCLGII